MPRLALFRALLPILAATAAAGPFDGRNAGFQLDADLGVGDLAGLSCPSEGFDCEALDNGVDPKVDLSAGWGFGERWAARLEFRTFDAHTRGLVVQPVLSGRWLATSGVTGPYLEAGAGFGGQVVEDAPWWYSTAVTVSGGWRLRPHLALEAGLDWAVVERHHAAGVSWPKDYFDQKYALYAAVQIAAY